MAQDDFIKDCMESMPQQGSLEDFKRAFCDVCINPECKRSRFTDSKWVTRMIMQEEALARPRFADPNDPAYDYLRSAYFEPVDEQTIKYYGGWVDVREDGTVVHHGETPHEEKDASKFEAAVASLKGGVEAPVEAPEPEPQPEPTPPPARRVVEVPDPPMPEPTPEPEAVVQPKPQPPSQKPQAPRPRNTEVPKSGILLGPQQIIQRPSHLLQPPEDPWAVDSGSKRDKNGRLTVRVSDGKVVKKD